MNSGPSAWAVYGYPDQNTGQHRSSFCPGKYMDLGDFSVGLNNIDSIERFGICVIYLNRMIDKHI